MNPENELLDTIDNFLNGGMPEMERIAFEGKIALDETLAKKVNEVRATNQAIYYASLAELKATIGEDIKNIKYNPSFDWKKASYISIASLVMLSGIATYFATKNTTDKTIKPEVTDTIEDHKQLAIHQENTSSITKELGKNKSLQSSSSKEENKNNISIDSSSKNKSAIPVVTEKTRIENTNLPSQNTEIKNEKNADLNSKKIDSAILKESKINCDKTFKLDIEPSCKQKETGSITISSDGTYNYLFQVDNRSNSGSKGFFYNIAGGDYEILVTYNKECLYKKKVTVEEKWCAMNTAFSFNPDYHESWVLQYETGASGKVIIYDRSGKEVYSSIFGGGNEFWDGTDIHGSIAAVGIYVAIIKYSDGRQEKVELTIVR